MLSTIEYSEVNAAEDLDSRGRKVTTVKCHGRLIAETGSAYREPVGLVQPIAGLGSRCAGS